MRAFFCRFFSVLKKQKYIAQKLLFFNEKPRCGKSIKYIQSSTKPKLAKVNKNK